METLDWESNTGWAEVLCGRMVGLQLTVPDDRGLPLPKVDIEQPLQEFIGQESHTELG